VRRLVKYVGASGDVGGGSAVIRPCGRWVSCYQAMWPVGQLLSGDVAGDSDVIRRCGRLVSCYQAMWP